MPDSEALTALREERKAIASQIETLQAQLKDLRDRLNAIDVAIGNIAPSQSDSRRPRWGSSAYRRRQIL